MKQPPTDLRSRLAHAAKSLGLRMPQMQLLLSQERFLTRIAAVDEEQRLIWKGGSLILRRYTHMRPPRFTTDIDLMAKEINIAQAEELITKAMKLDLHDSFRFTNIKKTPMQRDTPYGGERFEIAWEFQQKKNSEPLRLDLCIGDDVDPLKVKLSDIYLLEDDSSQATLSVYPPEFIIAEKVETMARFKTGNSRLKDFIDIWSLIHLDSSELSRDACTLAIQRCFKRRGSTFNQSDLTEILSDPDFQELMEAARKRNFPKLTIPTVPEMFQQILDFLEGLSIPN